MADSHSSLTPNISDISYRSWGVVSGYFDGDGTVEFSVRGLRVDIRLAFDENWKPLLDQLRLFLISRFVYPGEVRRKGPSRTWHLVVSRRSGVVTMAKAMIPFVVKKRQELKAVVDYLEGGTTASEYVGVMNHCVSMGERLGKIGPAAPNYSLQEGVGQSRRTGESKRREKRVTVVPTSVEKGIISDRVEKKMKFDELSSKYGYSRWILRRVFRQSTETLHADNPSGRR